MMVSMPLDQILRLWRPGSHDTADGPEGANLEWTWSHEAHDLLTRDRERTAAIADRVLAEGIDYANAYGAEITLGSDGRVWDGHHRLVVARAMGIERLTVDVVEKGGSA